MDRSDLITTAYEIASEYDGNLTIRQLYYQFVARGYIPNGQREYKRIVAALTKARLDGSFPLDWVEDRTRSAQQSACLEHHSSIREALAEAADYFHQLPQLTLYSERWYGQPVHVTVGVEKEALAGVFERPCASLGVGLFVFRGYASISSLYQFAQNLEAAYGVGAESAVMLYFGDHDPDGWEIPRSAEQRIQEIADVAGLAIPDFEIRRMALTMDQIRQYQPPPFPAKVSSSRYAAYVAEHRTRNAWELDALRPDVLQQLIITSVESLFDRAIHQGNQQEIAALQEELRTTLVVDFPEWLHPH